LYPSNVGVSNVVQSNCHGFYHHICKSGLFITMFEFSSFGLGFGFCIHEICTKYCALIVMPMHKLNFILDFKTIIFGKVNYWDHSVIWEWLNAIFELLILPLGNKVVPYKILQLWLQILEKLYCISLHVQ
jgi:hypothetical protein